MRVLACFLFILSAWAADFRPAAYGARADGKILDTAALKTIDAAVVTEGRDLGTGGGIGQPS